MFFFFPQNYINSLCCPEYTSPVQFPERFYSEIFKYKDTVERDSKAVVILKSNNHATVQGEEIAVAIATSAIEEKVKELEKGQNGTTDATNVEQEKLQTIPVSQIDPSLKEFAMKLGYTEEAIQQVLRKQAGKEVDQNILLRELINVSSPSLLQKAKPSESVVPANQTPIMPPRSEVVARGPSAAYPPAVVANSWLPTAYYDASNSSAMPSRSDNVARGQATFPSPWLSEQGTYEPYERLEDDPFLYQQVVGDSIPIDTSSDLRHIVIDGSNVAMR